MPSPGWDRYRQGSRLLALSKGETSSDRSRSTASSTSSLTLDEKQPDKDEWAKTKDMFTSSSRRS